MNSALYPKVSVFLTAFNHEAFIGDCVDSILSQDYPNLEIVIADDASTDRTQEILREYADRHPGLFELILRERNIGVTRNASEGFAQTTGEYVAMFSGDDVMLPGKLHKQVRYMEAHPDVVMCYHDLEIFDSESGELLGYFNHGEQSHYPHEGGAELLVLHGTFCGGSSLMLRRSAAPYPAFDARIPTASDWLFEIKVAATGKIGFVNETLAKYRRHSRSLSLSWDQRIGPDLRITLAIVDEQFPHLRPYARRFRLLYFGRKTAKALWYRRPVVAAGYFRDLCRSVMGLPGAYSSLR